MLTSQSQKSKAFKALHLLQKNHYLVECDGIISWLWIAIKSSSFEIIFLMLISNEIETNYEPWVYNRQSIGLL